MISKRMHITRVGDVWLAEYGGVLVEGDSFYSAYWALVAKLRG